MTKKEIFYAASKVRNEISEEKRELEKLEKICFSGMNDVLNVYLPETWKKNTEIKIPIEDYKRLIESIIYKRKSKIADLEVEFENIFEVKTEK